MIVERAYTEIVNSQTTQLKTFYPLEQFSDLIPYFMNMLVSNTDIDSSVHRLPQKNGLCCYIFHCTLGVRMHCIQQVVKARSRVYKNKNKNCEVTT